MPGTWEGGCGYKPDRNRDRLPGEPGGRPDGKWQCNDNFKDCMCGGEDWVQPEANPPAEQICAEGGLGIFSAPGKVDPTGGANYMFRCGGEPSWMQCNIDAGKCKKVGGDCANCTNSTGAANCFYKCTSQPKPCNLLKTTASLITDPTDPYLEDIPGIQSDPGPAGGGAYG